ncbi:MAG TPA: hypothetical protein VF533_24320 [Solirubrobacteraceae bacterium]|jgi:hypothetical protein
MTDEEEGERGFCEAGNHPDDYEAVFGCPMLHEPSTTWAHCEDHADEALADIADMARDHGMSFEATMRAVAKLYGDSERDEDAVFLAERLSDLPRDESVDLTPWQAAGFSDLDAFQWLVAGATSPPQAQETSEHLAAWEAVAWANTGVPAPEAGRWRALGITNPRDAHSFHANGISPEQAAPLLAAGATIHEALDKLAFS